MCNFQKVLLEGECALPLLPDFCQLKGGQDGWSLVGILEHEGLLEMKACMAEQWNRRNLGPYTPAHGASRFTDCTRETSSYIAAEPTPATCHSHKKSYKVVYFMIQASDAHWSFHAAELVCREKQENKTDMRKEPCRKIGDCGAWWKTG